MRDQTPSQPNSSFPQKKASQPSPSVLKDNQPPGMRRVAIERDIPELEAILAPWRATLGEAFAGYRNHAYRVLHFAFFQHEVDEDQRRKLIIAAAFHHLGAYTEGALSHLDTSCQLADDYLQRESLSHKSLSHKSLGAWRAEMADILRHHQKLSKVKKAKDGQTDRLLVEIFRVAYITDVSMGFIKSYLPGPFVATVNDAFASEGYYSHLARSHLTWLRQHPLQPFPLFKW